jgi:hypothetical protein
VIGDQVIVTDEARLKRTGFAKNRKIRAGAILSVAVALTLLPSAVAGEMPLGRGHARPYLMPESERVRILQRINNEHWARDELQRIRVLANNDGYWSALLYVLEGDKSHVSTAKRWLMRYGAEGGDLGERALKVDRSFFRKGQPWLGDVYYNIDEKALVAYDWIYSALEPKERAEIETGIFASAKFRKNAMDRWTQTPNLVFKPTFMVAVAGLVTGNRELTDWGFTRNPGSALGGYFAVLDTMLKDGGPWAEAPIYAIAQKPLSLILRMSHLLQLYDGTDWFRRRSANGGSPQGLLQYYIDTAYPIERTGFGQGQIRVATYGDGATNPMGDLFLANPAGPGLQLHEELAEAYDLSGDPRYASFLTLLSDYRPTLLGRTLPPHPKLPPAPSRVWPTFGVAMLRSEESPAYWTNGHSIAVLQRMTQSYGHGHADAFSITLHGAGRLLYPDYNFIQYENPALGWTRNTIAHNTLIVDGQESGNAEPTVQHDFSRDVKFLNTSASGVFAGVDQTRALMLTREYLLDFFFAASEAPHTYDYLLHSFGRASPVSLKSFAQTDGLGDRYSVVHDQRATTTDKAWVFDLILDEERTRQKERAEAAVAAERKMPVAKIHFGDEWYKHTASVRVTMAGAPRTNITYGVGPDGLTLLSARRSGVTDNVFVAVHEPFVGGELPHVSGVTQLNRSKKATVVRVDAKGFTDYAAVSLGPQREQQIHAIADRADRKSLFAFKNYGYLRILADGSVTARGEWISFSIPGAHGPVVLNGTQVEARFENGYLVYGSPPGRLDTPFREAPPSPLTVVLSPDTARMLPRDHRIIRFRLSNPLNSPVSGHLEFDLPEGLTAEPKAPGFGPIAANRTEEIVVTLNSDDATAGLHVIPYRVTHKLGGNETATRSRSFKLTIGPVLEAVYPGNGQPAFYQINGQRYVTKADMFSGLFDYLSDDDGIVRLEGSPLFTFSDGNKALLFEGTKNAFTWPVQTPAQLTAQAYDRCRWQALFFADRITVRMDRDWTQFEKAHFIVPGKWISSSGRPHWTTVLSLGGPLHDLPTFGSTHTVKAAELAFPGADWNVCFDFMPAQQVTFHGTELRFSLGSLTNDQWTIGFCSPGSLDRWRWK